MTGFDAASIIPPLKLRRVDEVGRITIGAGLVALEQAGFPKRAEGYDEVGVALGSFTAGVHASAEYLQSYLQQGPASAPALLFSNTVGNAPASICGLEFALRGPNATLMHKEASGLAAIEFGAHLIRRGKSPAMLAGGADVLESSFYRVHDWFHVLAPDPEPCRPFDANRRGFLLGEGAFLFVLEDAAHAAARSAPVLATILGTATGGSSETLNAWPGQPDALVRIIRRALARAEVPADAIDVVYASANGSIALDAVEATALGIVFGARPVAVTAIKGAIGESGGGGRRRPGGGRAARPPRHRAADRRARGAGGGSAGGRLRRLATAARPARPRHERRERRDARGPGRSRRRSVGDVIQEGVRIPRVDHHEARPTAHRPAHAAADGADRARHRGDRAASDAASWSVWPVRARPWRSPIASVRTRRARWPTASPPEATVSSPGRATSVTNRRCRPLRPGVTGSLGPVDILVNNAGITGDSFLLMMDTARWSRVLRVNLDGAYFCTRAVLRGMLLRGWGRIINITSPSAMAGLPGPGQLRGLESRPHRVDQVAARELAPKGVLVNAVSPGLIETDMLEEMPGRGARRAAQGGRPRAAGDAGGGRRPRGVSRVAGGQLHHRAGDRRRWGAALAAQPPAPVAPGVRPVRQLAARPAPARRRFYVRRTQVPDQAGDRPQS